MRAHQARVRLIALTFLGQSEEADDAAQEIFHKAFQSLGSFKGDAAFATWIGRIAENHCRDLLRRRRRRPAESLDALVEERGDSLESLGRILAAPDETAARTPEELALLGRLFDSLPEEDREILALREAEELTYEEMAARLGCSLDAVKGRLKRARQHLEAKCRPVFHDTPGL